jgi:hypothetical protein
MGGLKPRSQTRFYGNSEVKPPWMGILRGWVTFLSLDFQCTLPVLSTWSFWDYLGEREIFNQTCGSLGACPWGRLGAGWLVRAHSRVHL